MDQIIPWRNHLHGILISKACISKRMGTRLLTIILAMISLMVWQGCEYQTIAPVDCTANPVVLELVSVEDAHCALMDGKVQVSASGGSGTYQFKMDNGEAQQSALFEGLAAGLYEITAFDSNLCMDTLLVNVRNSNGLNIAFEITAAGCKTSDGTLSVTAFDGTAPYRFALNEGAFSAGNTFTGLPAGEYTLRVNDASGCDVSQKIRIRSGVSYANSISGIIETNCAVSGCHNGSQFPDFRVFKNIQDNAAQIKTLTANGSMPPGNPLNQADIDKIACWVDDGAPDN
jgi:hypothetical protein